MRRFCLMAAAAAALVLAASPLAARTSPHHRWYAMTLRERRAVVLHEIRVQRAPVRWWIAHRRTARYVDSSAAFAYCRAIGVAAPREVCAHAQRVIRARVVLARIDAKLAAQAAADRRAELVRRHYAGWLCIHSGEGAWNANTGNGYLGGLQMTPGWGGLARPDLVSPATQIATAEFQASLHSWSWSWMHGQWPNTFPPCAGYF